MGVILGGDFETVFLQTQGRTGDDMGEVLSSELLSFWAPLIEMGTIEIIDETDLFFDAMEQNVSVAGTKIDFSVATIVEALGIVLEEVLYIPQLTYVVPLSGESCLAYTMKPRMTFGRSVGQSLHF